MPPATFRDGVPATVRSSWAMAARGSLEPEDSVARVYLREPDSWWDTGYWALVTWASFGHL